MKTSHLLCSESNYLKLILSADLRIEVVSPLMLSFQGRKIFSLLLRLDYRIGCFPPQSLIDNILVELPKIVPIIGVFFPLNNQVIKIARPSSAWKFQRFLLPLQIKDVSYCFLNPPKLNI